MGIRQLTEADREQTLQFLQAESALNLFLIGNIYNQGLNQEFQQFWGDFDTTGQLRGVLHRYRGNWISWAPEALDVEGFAEVISTGQEIEMLSGVDRVTEQFQGIPGLPFRWEKRRQTHFACLTDVDGWGQMEREIPFSIRRMTLEDVPMLSHLSEQIAEFDRGGQAEELRASLKSGAARGYWVEDGDQAVAMVRTAAENPASAMVVGVGTHSAYRRQGLATQLMIRLCREVWDEGKSLCPFYDNPRAGAIYRRLGFREIGFWNMIGV
ncbi:GNAT family N-acetyltransferase [Kroppenstedtia sanguinis]|uniref:GNAT family N-acetyltransferase n=1 Tax=Kroppenstedtia sanguinis TaxID=1380684 RepID=A0ABW4C6T3_9BACL